MIFEGSCTALVTPFNKDGSVNYVSIKNLLDFQIKSGTKAILILGTTGESPTITEEERNKIIKFCSCVINKKIPLIVGCGTNCTQTSITHCKQAEKLGADGALLVTPYYNKSNQIGLYKHFKKIANNCNLPLILYNIPSRTGINLEINTILKLARIKNIVGIKEASGNINLASELLQKMPENFYLYSGDDSLTYPLMLLGAKGVISVTANCYPTEVSLLCDYCKKYDLFNAKLMHNYLYKINKALFLDINPTCIKHYLNLKGFCVGKPRAPLFLPEAKIKRKLLEIFNHYEN